MNNTIILLILLTLFIGMFMIVGVTDVFANGGHTDETPHIEEEESVLPQPFSERWWLYLIISLILMSALSWGVYRYLQRGE